MKKMIFAIMILFMAMPTGLAQGVVVDASAPYDTVASTQYLVVTYPVGATAQNVSINVTQTDTGAAVFTKAYGEIAGGFYSDDIYLKNPGQYLIDLTVGGDTFSFHFTRTLLRLNDNTACSYGVRLQDRGKDESWLMGTAVDLTSSGTCTYPLVASNKYVIGSVTISVNSESLLVDYALEQGLSEEISQQALYVFTDLNDLSLNQLRLHSTYGFGSPISIANELSGATQCIVYMPITLSYDPNGLAVFEYQSDRGQTAIWEQMEQMEALDSVG